MGLLSHLPISAHVAPCWSTRNYFFSLMHPIGPELLISAHVACACVCRQLYVLRASHAHVQATVGVGTVIFVYIGVAYTRGGGKKPRLTAEGKRLTRYARTVCFFFSHKSHCCSLSSRWLSTMGEPPARAGQLLVITSCFVLKPQLLKGSQ